MLIIGEDAEVGEWVRVRMPDPPEAWGPHITFGWQGPSGLRAGVVFNDFHRRDGNISMHVASDGSRRWLAREFLHCVFRYPFNQLRVKRITLFIDEANLDSLRFAHHLGFQIEGVLRRALPNNHNLVVAGMLREECRWL